MVHQLATSPFDHIFGFIVTPQMIVGANQFRLAAGKMSRQASRRG
jgi:hypothetical protein